MPTMGGVAGSVAVREWSPRDVWYRNRECDRGIKSRRFKFSVRVSVHALVRPSLARACSLPAVEGKKKRKKARKRKEKRGKSEYEDRVRVPRAPVVIATRNVPSQLVSPFRALARLEPVHGSTPQIVYLLRYLLYKGL